ncbi:hypothetical protein NPA07_00110 [Mycoplasmopsis caviae]|nr:hypothetical protein [Mycoplasmopsis caviae]UUD35273.1 hypothetical protein NPA07_00110 [Mycoplasmopsis caviae]
MKKKRLLIGFSFGLALPTFVSSSCGTQVKNLPNDPNNPNTSVPSTPLTPAKVYPKPHTLKPATPVKKDQPAPDQGKPWVSLIPSKPYNPNPPISKPNITINPLNKEKLPNWIDPNLTTAQLKDKLLYFKHNYGFVDTNKRLNAEKISLRKGKEFQIKLGNQNLNESDTEVFVKHDGNVYTLDEYNALASKLLTVSKTGLIKCNENCSFNNSEDYIDGIWIKEKSTNNYFSLSVNVLNTEDAETDEMVEKGDEAFKRIANYFTSIEDRVERILAINNFVMNALKYNMKRVGRKNQDYFGINELIATCEGYSRMVQRIASYSGFEDIELQEDWLKPKSDRHAWNKVKIDGHWYYLDTTWNDDENKKVYRGKNEMTTFLLKGQLMSKSRFGVQDTADEAKEYRHYPFEKDGLMVNEFNDLHKVMKMQIISGCRSKDNKYSIGLVYPVSLMQSIDQELGNGLRLREGAAEHGYFYRHTMRSINLLKQKFTDLDFDKNEEIKILSAKLINENKVEFTFDKKVDGFIKECFKLTFKDATGVELRYGDVDKFETSGEGKKVTLSLKNTINLSHIQNAKINFEINRLGYTFTFVNNKNEIDFSSSYKNHTPAQYIIESGRRVKFENTTNIIKYAFIDWKINKSVKWNNYVPGTSFDVGPLNEYLLVQSIDPTSGKVFSIQRFAITRFSSFLEPQLSADKKYITNVSNIMEYNIEGTHEWHPVTNGYIKVEYPGQKYKIRYKSSNEYKLYSSDIKELDTK